MLVTKFPTLMQSMVPKLNMLPRDPVMRLGASLRDRATLPSPLRGLDPSGGYPSRLRSLRSLRAPLARRLAALTAAAGPTRSRQGSTASSAPPPRPPRAGAARPARRGSTPCGRRCRLRLAPARAPPGAVLAALVRALLRSTPALRSAPRRAVVPTPVRAPPPPPPAACCARLPAAPAAPSATQSPWRLPSAGFAGVDSPIAHAADSAVLTARGGLGFHT